MRDRRGRAGAAALPSPPASLGVLIEASSMAEAFADQQTQGASGGGGGTDLGVALEAVEYDPAVAEAIMDDPIVILVSSICY